jgi:hypothetical protein
MVIESQWGKERVGHEREGFLSEEPYAHECEGCIHEDTLVSDMPCHDCYPTQERESYESQDVMEETNEG